jgi:hypothetical protein
MYAKLFKLLGFLAPPSPIIVGTWSLSILIGCMYSIYLTKQISMPIAVIFSAVLTNFTAHKISKVMNGTDQTVDKNLDCQGETK